MKIIKDHNQLYWCWVISNSTYEQTPGDPVILDGEFGELDLFIYRIRHTYRQNAGYRVAEGITGMAVSNSGKTQKKAIDNAIEQLTRVGIDYTVNEIYREMKSGKLSPRYARWFEGCIDKV